MTKIFNKYSEKNKRKRLRRYSTQTERILWQYLQGWKLKNYKFRRQYSIGRYVVDFYCPKLKLVIEIDGGYHNEAKVKDYDSHRQDYIESFGIKFLRFTNDQIFSDIESVVAEISKFIEEVN